MIEHNFQMMNLGSHMIPVLMDSASPVSMPYYKDAFVQTVNSEIFVRILFSRNFADAKFLEN